MSRQQSFASQVSAVSPLREAIDGSERPKSRRTGKSPSKPLDRSDRFFCSNKNCDHETLSPVEQARHMAGEFWEVTKALVKLAPESPEALKLTGGVILRNLTSDDLLAGIAEVEWCKRRGLTAPVAARLRKNEYLRRSKAGELEPSIRRVQRHPRETCKSGRHPWIKENIHVRPDGSSFCRLCQNEKRSKAEPRELAPCGTSAAYQRHGRAGEEPCQPCRAARAADAKRYREQQERNVA